MSSRDTSGADGIQIDYVGRDLYAAIGGGHFAMSTRTPGGSLPAGTILIEIDHYKQGKAHAIVQLDVVRKMLDTLAPCRQPITSDWFVHYSDELVRDMCARYTMPEVVEGAKAELRRRNARMLKER